MTFTIIGPEVAGGWGSRTVADTSVHPPKVTQLHYEIQGWLGDDLLESFPCFIVSDRLATELERSSLTGWTLDSVEVTTSPEFEELQPGTPLPSFQWLKVSGRAGVDDFGVDPGHMLVVSANALHLLERFGLDNADRRPYTSAAG